MIKIPKIRVFWLVFLAFLVLFFLFLKVVPFGRITYSRVWPRGISSGQGFISDFKPAARFDAAARQSLKIVADPVYFSLFAPRRFDKATVTVKYRRALSSSTPIIELGLLKDKVSGRYELRPLENKLIDDKRFVWDRLSEGDGLTVLQAEKYYSAADDFFRDLKSDNLKNCSGGAGDCVAAYNYSFEPKFSLPNYRAAFPITINQPLRGAHQFYVYFPGGAWRLSFDFVDLNQDKEADPIEIALLSGSETVARASIADTNLNPAGGDEELRSAILQGGALPAGVYKAEIKVSDDIVMKKLVSSSAKLVFINRIWPVSSPSLPLKISSDGSYLQAQTLNPASLGDIAYGARKLTVAAAYRQFSLPPGDDYSINEIKLNKDDVVLENNGVFAIPPASFFSPGVKKIDRYFQAGNQIKYIVAGYTPPSGNKKLRSATAEFDLRDASRENGKYTFLFSIPGLVLSDGESATSTANYLEIKEIEIKLQGKTLWQKITGR